MNVRKMASLFTFFFPSFKDFLLAFITGVSTALFIYLAFLQRHFFSYRYLASAILIAIAVTIISAFLNRHLLSPAFRKFPQPIKIFAVGAAFFLSIILLINIKIEPVYFLLPDEKLEISFTIEPLPPDEEGVRLLWIETGQGYVPYTYIQYDGQWERVFGNTIFPPGQSVAIRWTGKTGTAAEIAFRRTSFSQPLQISWNDSSEIFDLRGVQGQNIQFPKLFDIPWIFFVPFCVSFFITSFYSAFIFLIWLGSWPGLGHDPARLRKVNPLVFAIPMLVIWLVILLILWPGILTNDSLTTWYIASSGKIDDWQSAFYTYLLSILMRIVPSPAFVLIIQIIAFSLTTVWGLSILQKRGVPVPILWCISLLMALFPPTLLFIVTLWKDIPYAIALLAFTIATFAIAASNGEWGARRARWVALGIIAFLVAIFRHNGGPVALVVLLALPLVFRKYWKAYIGAFAVALLLYILVRGPFYDRVTVQDDDTGQSNLIYLHHIAAHLDAATDLAQKEKEYLDGFLPTEDWDYDCCYVGNISYDKEFERDAFLSNTAANQKIAFSLFERAPLVDIRHAFCAGEMAYQFMNNQQCWHMKSLHGFISTQAGKEDWIGEPNRSGISENSLFPALVEPLILVLRPFGIFDASLAFYLRPAFWLFISAVAMAVTIIRQQNLRFILPLLPALVQSLLLFLIAFAPSFRYYYGNCLAGIFLLGAIFMPAQSPHYQEK